MEERLIHPISNTEVQPRGPPPYSITAEVYPNLFERKGSEEEGTRILRDQPPAHYTLKINSFSQLAKLLSDTRVEKYESGEFEVSGYKCWKLLLYPNGDKNRGGSGHISLYLVLSETNVLRLGLEVHASYRFFVYDQIRDEYLVIQDADMKERRFHTFKIERGFSKLLALSTLNDAANGYLVDDCCIFGAEVFVTNCTGKGESFFIIKQPTSNFSWSIDRFSSMDDYSTSSEEFIIRGHKWHLIVYPKGDAEGRDRSLSLFLELEDSNICHGKKIYVEYKFRVMDQVGNNHIERIGRDWFSSSSKIYGWPNFMPISDLTNKTKGYIVNDTVIVEADINLVCAAVKNLS